MALHILTPFSRPENFNFYYKNLVDRNVIWHPLTQDFFMSGPFIQQYGVLDIKEGWYPNIDKCNQFIKEFPIIDNDRYLFMNDDDWFEDNVFEQFNEQNDPEDDVCFISMKRGYSNLGTWNGSHGTFPLIVDLDRVIVGNIGFEQMCVKGRVLKQMEFENHGCFDGLMAMKLHDQYKVKPLYEVYALFNWLEKGRWDK